MGIMGSLYIGTSGLQSSQNSLNTVAHNLANGNTIGYTRQQILFGDKRYNTISSNMNSVSKQQTGLGVTYSKVRQVRDYFLDKTYRLESGRCAFYEAQYGAIDEVQTLLRELDGKAFNASLSNLWVSVQELANDPTSSVNQGALVQCASQFVENAKAVYDGLSSYQNRLNYQVQTDISRINEIGESIYDLNSKITAIESAGREGANDLRDARNSLLDELSQLTNMTYEEDFEGAVMVEIEGHQFVTRGSTYKIGLDQDKITGFYTPFWLTDAKQTVMADGTTKYNIENAKVFNLSVPISSSMDTDVGGIKAKLLARGDHKANYTDMQDADYYNSVIGDSVIMNMQTEFDTLIHNVVTKINGVLAMVSDPSSGYMMDGSNPLRLFEKISDEGYGEDLSPGKENTLYTISNLIINPDLMKTPTKLSFMKDGAEDKEAMELLKAAFEEEIYTLNPNSTSPVNFTGYYDSMVSQIANLGYVFHSIYENEVKTINSTDNARQQVAGVSDDEELSNMIRFQNAYNASSRYINVIDEMLEHILSTLGA